MTCVVSSPWQQPFNSTYGWAPMNLGDSTPTTSGIDRPQYGYASSEGESRHVSGGHSKKRASRAGTRSVSTLSAAQLERKRANDREAQRAIRQRTKDHIEGLERNISDLRAAHEASEKIAAVAHQRSRELEEENAYLRTKLGEVGYPMAVPPDNHRVAEQTLVQAHSTSPAAQQPPAASIPRPDSTSTPRSTLSINTSQSSSSRQGSWQQGPAGFAVTAASAPASLPAHSSIQLGPGLTNWRSHESVSSVHSNSEQHQLQAPQVYQNVAPVDRPQWGVPQGYPYQEQQRTPSIHHASPQPQQPYAHTAVPNYASGTQQPPPTSYVAPPQNEFQNMTVQSPATFPVAQQPPQPGYGQQPPYQMTHIQVPPASTNPTEYASQPGQIHPPQIPPPGFPTSQPEPHYGQPQVQPTMHYRDDPSSRGYSLTHYPTG